MNSIRWFLHCGLARFSHLKGIFPKCISCVTAAQWKLSIKKGKQDCVNQRRFYKSTSLPGKEQQKMKYIRNDKNENIPSQND